jgi:hypothetical protein
VIQLFRGLHPDMIRVAAASTYALLVILVALLAAGGPRGRTAAVRAGVAVAVVLVPEPGIAYQTLLSSPDHTGSGVPLLLTWLVLERAPRRLAPFAVTLLLAWGEIGDPLITFIGAGPLIAVSLVRLHRSRDRFDAWLVAAGLASVVLAHGFLVVVRSLGGFRVPAPPLTLAHPGELAHRAAMTVRMLGGLFGVGRPLHAGLAALVAVAVVTVVVRRGSAGRTEHLLALGLLINLVAEVVSNLSVDLLAAREIVNVLPLGAVLAGRVGAAGLSKARLTPVVPVALAVLVVTLAFTAPPRAQPAEDQDVADWLAAHHLTYGLASYWSSSNITLTTGGRVTVVPVAGGDRVAPYCWQSRTDWYDATRHDARFIVYDRDRSMYGPVTNAERLFGPPAQRVPVGRHLVLLYQHNLLHDLPPAAC